LCHFAFDISEAIPLLTAKAFSFLPSETSVGLQRGLAFTA
jgi:hypothetical protein